MLFQQIYSYLTSQADMNSVVKSLFLLISCFHITLKTPKLKIILLIFINTGKYGLGICSPTNFSFSRALVIGRKSSKLEKVKARSLSAFTVNEQVMILLLCYSIL